MRRYDAQSAKVLVYTFREGLLSRLGHDLELRAGRLALTIGDDDAVELVIPAHALRVVNAMLDGRPAPELLSAKDKREIEDVAANAVLEAKRFDVIRFVSTSVTPIEDGYDVTGELSMHGHARPLAFEVLRHGGSLTTQVSLHQTDFGITPYRAMLGGLRIRSEVRVHVSVPDPRSVDVTAEDVE